MSADVYWWSADDCAFAAAGAAAATMLSLAGASEAAESPPLKDLAKARGILYGSAVAAMQIGIQ